MKLTFDVDSEQFENAIIGDLKEAVEDLLKDPWSFAHDYKETLRTVDGLLVALEWYLPSRQVDYYKTLIKPEYNDLVTKAFPPITSDGMNIKVIGFRDLPSGDVNMEFDVNDKAKEFLIGVGMKKVLMDAVGDVLKEPEPKKPDVPGWDYWTTSF
jgi:hypothetical protein